MHTSVAVIMKIDDEQEFTRNKVFHCGIHINLIPALITI
jgi:hypothetical protein